MNPTSVLDISLLMSPRISTRASSAPTTLPNVRRARLGMIIADWQYKGAEIELNSHIDDGHDDPCRLTTPWVNSDALEIQATAS